MLQTLLEIQRRIVKRVVRQMAFWMVVAACCSFVWARQEPAVEYLPCKGKKVNLGWLDVFGQCEVQMQVMEADK
jgi:hypothetical protein